MLSKIFLLIIFTSQAWSCPVPELLPNIDIGLSSCALPNFDEINEEQSCRCINHPQELGQAIGRGNTSLLDPLVQLRISEDTFNIIRENIAINLQAIANDVVSLSNNINMGSETQGIVDQCSLRRFDAIVSQCNREGTVLKQFLEQDPNYILNWKNDLSHRVNTRLDQDLNICVSNQIIDREIFENSLERFIELYPRLDELSREEEITYFNPLLREIIQKNISPLPSPLTVENLRDFIRTDENLRNSLATRIRNSCEVTYNNLQRFLCSNRNSVLPTSTDLFEFIAVSNVDSNNSIVVNNYLHRYCNRQNILDINMINQEVTGASGFDSFPESLSQIDTIVSSQFNSTAERICQNQAAVASNGGPALTTTATAASAESRDANGRTRTATGAGGTQAGGIGITALTGPLAGTSAATETGVVDEALLRGFLGEDRLESGASIVAAAPETQGRSLIPNARQSTTGAGGIASAGLRPTGSTSNQREARSGGRKSSNNSNSNNSDKDFSTGDFGSGFSGAMPSTRSSGLTPPPQDTTATVDERSSSTSTAPVASRGTATRARSSGQEGRATAPAAPRVRGPVTRETPSAPITAPSLASGNSTSRDREMAYGRTSGAPVGADELRARTMAQESNGREFNNSSMKVVAGVPNQYPRLTRVEGGISPASISEVQISGAIANELSNLNPEEIRRWDPNQREQLEAFRELLQRREPFIISKEGLAEYQVIVVPTGNGEYRFENPTGNNTPEYNKFLKQIRDAISSGSVGAALHQIPEV